MNVGMFACVYDGISVCVYVRRYVGTVCMQVWVHRGEGYVCMMSKVARGPWYESSCGASGLGPASGDGARLSAPQPVGRQCGMRRYCKHVCLADGRPLLNDVFFLIEY